MAEISKHLMTFARKPRRELHPVLLAEVLDDTLDFLRTRLERAGAEVTVDQPDRSLTVRAGRARLQHVILNLLSNALDSMEHQPGEREQAPRLAFAVRAEGERAVLSLRDHGAGIPADALARIFDPFFTTKEVGEGLGLGLSISYNIVKDFDGVLRAENHPQGGAVFTIELPLLPVKPRSEEHTSELQSLMRISYAVFCLKKKIKNPRKIRYRSIPSNLLHTTNILTIRHLTITNTHNHKIYTDSQT